MAKRKVYAYRVESLSKDWSHEGPKGTLREAAGRAVQALSDNTGVMTRAHMNEVFSRILQGRGGTEKLADYQITIWLVEQ